MSEKLVFMRDDGYNIGDDTLFAERLKTLRKNNKVTQSYLSKLASLADSTYGTYERNESLPDAKTIYELAKFFNVSADYILCLTEDADPLEDVSITYFSPESKNDFHRIIEDIIVKTTFEKLIHQKEFVSFLYYVYTYLTFSVKLNKKTLRIIQEKNLSDKVFKIDTKDAPLQYGTIPDDRISISDVYYGLLHKALDDILKKLHTDSYFVKEMKTTVRRLILEKDFEITCDELNELFANVFYSGEEDRNENESE